MPHFLPAQLLLPKQVPCPLTTAVRSDRFPHPRPPVPGERNYPKILTICGRRQTALYRADDHEISRVFVRLNGSSKVGEPVRLGTRECWALAVQRHLRRRSATRGSYHYLEVKCLGCNTHQTVALDIIRRPKTTPVHELERYMRCKNCSELRRAHQSEENDCPAMTMVRPCGTNPSGRRRMSCATSTRLR